MTKFKFNYLENTLAYQSSESELWYQIDEEQQFTGNFNSQGFKLTEGWITFTIYANKIRAFYKFNNEESAITYYRKDLPKQEEIIFIFTNQDEVEKQGNNWVKKGVNHD